MNKLDNEKDTLLNIIESKKQMKLPKIGSKIYVPENPFCTGGVAYVERYESSFDKDKKEFKYLLYCKDIKSCGWHWEVIIEQQKSLKSLFKDKEAIGIKPQMKNDPYRGSKDLVD